MIESIEDKIGELEATLRHPTNSNIAANTEHVNFNKLGEIYNLKEKLWELKYAIRDFEHLCDHTDEEISRLAKIIFSEISCGRVNSAITTVLTLIDRSPEMREGYLLASIIIIICSSRLGWEFRIKSAVQCLNKCISLSPEWGVAWYWFGRAMQFLPEYNMAMREKCFSAAIHYGGKEAEANLEIASIHQNQSQYIESYNYLRRYVELLDERARLHPLGRTGVRVIGEVNCSAFGHLGELPDLYIKAMKLGWIPKVRTIMIAPEGRIANKSLLGYWSQYLEIVSDHKEIEAIYPLFQELEYNTAFIKLPDGHCANNRTLHCLVQEEWEKQSRKPLLQLTSEHMELGWNMLSKLGMRTGSWFVALHVRNPHYKREFGDPHNIHREAQLDTYLDAIKAITDRGGWVVRLTEASSPKLPQMPNVIDYGHTAAKSEEMDIFLLASARFLLGTSAGTLSVPSVFGVPSVATNFPPTLYRQPSGDIFIPKLVKDDKTGRILSFKETLSPPLVECERGSYFGENGYSFIDNTSEEIAAATVEMLDRLEGNLSYSEGDNKLQDSYRGLLDPIFGKFLTRISRQFIEKHQELLGS